MFGTLMLGTLMLGTLIIGTLIIGTLILWQVGRMVAWYMALLDPESGDLDAAGGRDPSASRQAKARAANTHRC